MRLPAPALALAAALAIAWSSPTEAYLKIGTSFGREALSLKWRPGTIAYFVNNSGAQGVSPDALRSAVERGFGRWNDVSTAVVDFQFGGFVSNVPFDADDVSTVGFDSRPELDRVLASTGVTYDLRTGEILEADIFFNSSFNWSASQGAQPGLFDLEAIAAHEAGHFLGLGHSAIGETERLASGGRRLIASAAVMFPIAFGPGNIRGRTLRADDIAGVSDIYPASDFRQATGSIQGRVTRNGSGVFGAHVVAFNLRTQDLVGNFTLEDDGGFVIAGLTPGLYVVRVEPLDDGDLISFFDGVGPDDLAFAPRFHDRVVVVPPGGSSDSVDVSVEAR
jgi:hypothetical protein